MEKDLNEDEKLYFLGMQIVPLLRQSRHLALLVGGLPLLLLHDHSHP